MSVSSGLFQFQAGRRSAEATGDDCQIERAQSEPQQAQQFRLCWQMKQKVQAQAGAKERDEQILNGSCEGAPLFPEIKVKNDGDIDHTKAGQGAEADESHDVQEAVAIEDGCQRQARCEQNGTDRGLKAGMDIGENLFGQGAVPAHAEEEAGHCGLGRYGAGQAGQIADPEIQRLHVVGPKFQRDFKKAGIGVGDFLPAGGPGDLAQIGDQDEKAAG
ncbi:hypothetical protein Salpa_5767 [Sporomusa sp. KB1]|nr:hypothetical protein Salpa_5767 [Sporomusa sp. KB1]